MLSYEPVLFQVYQCSLIFSFYFLYFQFLVILCGFAISVFYIFIQLKFIYFSFNCSNFRLISIHLVANALSKIFLNLCFIYYLYLFCSSFISINKNNFLVVLVNNSSTDMNNQPISNYTGLNLSCLIHYELLIRAISLGIQHLQLRYYRGLLNINTDNIVCVFQYSVSSTGINETIVLCFQHFFIKVLDS